MKWQEIREYFPNQWVLMEAITPRSENGYRIYETLFVANRFGDGNSAFDGYSQIRKEFPNREWVIMHTNNPKMVEEEVVTLEEKRLLGLRR